MQQELYNKYLQHLGLSEEYKRMKEASANNPRAYFGYGEKEHENKAKAYYYRKQMDQQPSSHYGSMPYDNYMDM